MDENTEIRDSLIRQLGLEADLGCRSEAVESPVQASGATRLEILEQARKCVCGQREEDYGSPEDNFQVIAEFWGLYLDTTINAADVANMMILLKVARNATGTKLDNWIDICGYAACGGEIEFGKKK